MNFIIFTIYRIKWNVFSRGDKKGNKCDGKINKNDKENKYYLQHKKYNLMPAQSEPATINQTQTVKSRELDEKNNKNGYSFVVTVREGEPGFADDGEYESDIYKTYEEYEEKFNSFCPRDHWTYVLYHQKYINIREEM